MTFLPGTFPAGALFGGAGQPGGLTFLTHLKDESSQTVYTFSGVAIGTPQADRRIIVAVCSLQSSEKAINSVTIGGVSATVHVTLNSASASNDTDLVIASALVPSGTTADIVVTHSAAADTCSVGTWSLYGETDSSPFATASDTSLSASTTLSTTIDIPDNGALIAAACAMTIDDQVVWSGVTQDYDRPLFEDFGIGVASGASRSGLGAESGRTVQAVFSGGAGPTVNTTLLAAISWQYA